MIILGKNGNFCSYLKDLNSLLTHIHRTVKRLVDSSPVLNHPSSVNPVLVDSNRSQI